MTQRAAYNDITSNDNQWQAMSNYARRFQQLPFVSYISLLEAFPGAVGEGGRGISKTDRQNMTREALEKGVILILANLFD
ncbi:hypothetical protein I8748_15185 [Nostoc sp. CENA67]|uniref:Uncharacterized protein n=1 Tax=Amazonocrinis nigriterrae CENA67 TaxID=2794033 RepID=A0A8J7HVR3_9NOST|nr:hypothetical protein [Amazonocrinis nigriterrae]MBH8563514.1 hypothetical protein [Amazonocrinis nigriterrae CENA67]